jgi:hypothetical protein
MTNTETPIIDVGHQRPADADLGEVQAETLAEDVERMRSEVAEIMKTIDGAIDYAFMTLGGQKHRGIVLALSEVRWRLTRYPFVD